MKTKLPVTRALQQIASTLPLDPKRRSKGSEIQKWYPYYAGFSESFARTVLKNIPLRIGARILDPWNGSGTTTHVADQLGFQAIGFDVNPVATLVACAKLARPRDAKHVLGLVRRLAVSSADSPAIHVVADPLAEWLRPSVVSQYRTIEAAILADLATGRSQLPLVPRDTTLPPLASFLILALMRAARSLADVRASTNPTWVVPVTSVRGSRAILGRRWLALVEEMADELSCDSEDFKTSSEIRIADARSLPMRDSSIDLALTSPPYCTRIDYAVSTSFELAALGIGRHSAEFDSLRRTCMGTPLTREVVVEKPDKGWPTEIKTLLRAIKNHPSKDSHSYYYKTYWQYFSDCERALRELHRTLKARGAAIIVVQSSYYKEIRVDLPKLYVSLGRAVGFAASVISEVEVGRAITQINSRSLRHRIDSTYHESVISLEKVA